MNSSAIHQNHYVPIWYQKGFAKRGSASLYFLNLDPPKTVVGDGRIIVARPVNVRAPSSCFWAQDLYTTKLGSIYNDDIEKYFFGEIDNNGAKAVKAFAKNDLRVMHEMFQEFFQYLDAQKLRTPKGLDWIRSSYPQLTQLMLMIEMQSLRQMHCTMWYECVREIVSAEKSDVKFIVTDHPVTAYNSKCPPDSDLCRYPNDPPIELVGTQTVFALDAETCIVLSNLEYAKDPDNVDLTRPRTHARYRGTTIARTDAFIRKRQLTRDEVISINRLLKARACKYVAAGNKDWLYPEQALAGSWSDIGRTLLPPKDELWHFGGEIIIGYADGTSHYQDAFGRTTGPHEHLRKRQPAAPPKRDDQCGCGSGRKFKNCCERLPREERPSWEFYSIRERNGMLINAVKDILGLDDGKSWDDVRKNLSDDQVKRIHEVLEALWPKETDIAQLLPRPDKEVFRAVFIGFVDPRTIALNVITWLLYFDEIIIANPFANPTFMKPEFSPVHSPSKHKAQVLKNVLLLLALEPFIKSGQVHMVPDPSEFNDVFRKSIWHMAEQRIGNSVITDQDMVLHKKLAEDDFRRSTSGLPDESLRHLIQQTSPEIADGDAERVIKYMREERARDPFAPLQPMVPGEEGAQLLTVRGLNLELGLFLAQFTGSVVYTDMSFHWTHLQKHTSAGLELGEQSSWVPLIERVNGTTFILDGDPQAIMDLRESDASKTIRHALRKVAALATTDPDGPKKKLAKEIAAELHQGIKSMRKRFHVTDTPHAARFNAKVEISIPKGGFERNTIRRLLLSAGPETQCFRKICRSNYKRGP
jgi:hypothetical protein